MRANASSVTIRHLSVRLTSVLVAAVFVMGTFWIPAGSFAAETDAADAVTADPMIEDTQDAGEIVELEELLLVTDECGNAIELEDLDEDEYDGFIYKIKDDTTKVEIGEMENAIASGGSEETGEVSEIMDQTLYEADSLEAIEKVADPDMIEYIQPDYIVKADAAPNDPYYAERGWYLEMIHAPYVWDKGLFGKDVVVAVLDSGINKKHIEFKNTAFEPAYNAINNTTTVTDNAYHGTATTGVIVAAYNNGNGLTGIMPEVSVMPVKVLEKQVDGTIAGNDSWVIKGINYAVANGADVINMSFGGEQYDPAMETACQQAVDSGAILIASSGNDGTEKLRYPAAFDSVISVGSIEQDGAHSDFSNYGQTVDVAAPGRGIWAPTRVETNNGVTKCYYQPFNGTSMAAPQVSAMAILAKTLDCNVNSSGFKQIIKATAIDKGAKGRDDYFGYGLMDLSRVYAYMTDSFDTYKASLSCTSFVYNGLARKPAVTVRSEFRTMPKTDYKVTYAEGRKAVGTYKVTVEGQGAYEGTKTLKFMILPPLVKKLKEPERSRTTIKVKWYAMSDAQKTKYKSAITGYQVRISKTSDFKNAKYVRVKGFSKTYATVKKLKRNTTYYVQYRAYKNVGEKRYCSAWSSKIKTKTK